MTERTTGSFDSDGERIYYESVGSGDPVVLSHGLGGNHASWFQVVPALAERHRVITWDQRGFGNSTRRTDRYGPEPAVDDLRGLLDYLGLDRVQLVGQSMGGWVAMGFALRHRDRLRSLVLTDTLAGVSTPEIATVVARARAEPLRRPDGDPLARHPALGELFSTRHPALAFLYHELSSMGDKPDDAEVIGMLAAMEAPVDLVAGLDLPVLLVAGESDQLCPPAAMKQIAGLIPGARFEVIEDAGHSPYFEQPGKWAGVVGRFLTEHVPG